MIDRVGKVWKAERHLQMDLVRVHLRFDPTRKSGEREFAVVQLASESLEVLLLTIDGDIGDLFKLKREREAKDKPAHQLALLTIHIDSMCWCLEVTSHNCIYKKCPAISGNRQLRDDRSHKVLWNVGLDETTKRAVRLSSA